jgi:hypothetical protein
MTAEYDAEKILTVFDAVTPKKGTGKGEHIRSGFQCGRLCKEVVFVIESEILT